MAEKVEMWKAEDGRIFPTEKEARVHDCVTLVLKRVRLPNNLTGGYAYEMFTDAFSRGIIALPTGAKND